MKPRTIAQEAEQPASCAIVLAGGKSRRMGQDKALLPYAGETFLEHAIALMQTLTPNIVVVADRADRYALTSAQVVADHFPDAGPVGGIVTGLLAAGPGAHYVVPCDMPALNPGVLARLHACALPEYDAVVPLLNGDAEPLVAVYRERAAPKLQKYLEAGQRSARGALNGLHVRYLEEKEWSRVVSSRADFANINTPEELAEFMEPKSSMYKTVE